MRVLGNLLRLFNFKADRRFVQIVAFASLVLAMVFLGALYFAGRENASPPLPKSQTHSHRVGVADASQRQQNNLPATRPNAPSPVTQATSSQTKADPKAAWFYSVEKSDEQFIEFMKLAQSNDPEFKYSAQAIRDFCSTLINRQKSFEEWFEEVSKGGQGFEEHVYGKGQPAISGKRREAAKRIFGKCSGFNVINVADLSHLRSVEERLRLSDSLYRSATRVRREIERGATIESLSSELDPMRDSRHPLIAERLNRAVQFGLNLPGTGSELTDALIVEFVSAAALCSSGKVLCDRDSYRWLQTCLDLAACDAPLTQDALLISLKHLGVDTDSLSQYVETLRQRLSSNVKRQ